jgi:hypothetical protein
VGQLITDGFYYADGKPGSRHMYDHWHWDHITDLFIMIGGSGTWPNGFNVQASDGFNPVTNLWDAPGTWPYIDATGFGTVIDTLRGEIWTNGFKRVSTTSKTYLTNNTTPTVGARYPVSYDSLRDQMFTLLWGDGGPAGPSNTLVAGKWACTGGVEQTVTFNSSAAYSQFVSEALVSSYAGMTYNTDLDVFYWTSGYSTSQGHIYVITPNNTTTWDMSLFNFAAGSATLDAAPNAGINGRLKYHKLLKGIVINPSGSGQWYFIKTS